MDAQGVEGLAVLVAAVGAWYGLRVLLYPHRTCPACGGEKKIRLAGTNRFRDCSKCNATGELRRGGS